jgi:hypothetical protein
MADQESKIVGTALVVYEDQSAWEAAHDLQHERAVEWSKHCRHIIQLFKVGMFLLAVSVFGVVFEFGWLSSLNSENFPWVLSFVNVVLFGVLIILAVYHRAKFWSLLSMLNKEVRELPFDCPTCNQTIHLQGDWLCGHCRARNKTPKDPTVFLGCKNPRCYTAKGIPKHRAQAGLQCPHCKDHIVLNPLLYKDIGSYRHDLKYPGVARFLDDKDPPTLGGVSPEKLPDVGDLGTIIKAAMDRSI